MIEDTIDDDGADALAADPAHAQDGAMAFLERLCDTAREDVLLVVGGLRAGVVRTRLAQLVGAISAREKAGPLVVGALSQELVAAMGPGLSPAARRRLIAKAGGNPLLARQLLAGDALEEDTGGHTSQLDTGVQEAIRRHLETLTPECRSALAVAAVIGDEVSLGLLARVSGKPVAVLLDRCAEAVAARILVRSSGTGSYRFQRALVRDALYQSLAPSERAVIHGAAAVAKLEATPPSTPRSDWRGRAGKGRRACRRFLPARCRGVAVGRTSD